MTPPPSGPPEQGPSKSLISNSRRSTVPPSSSLGLFQQARDLRFRATQLQKRGTVSMNEVALVLLEQLIRDCPEPSQLSAAHAQRAACLRMLGRVDEAVGAYRSAFDAEREFQQVHCLAYLEFAELVLAVGRTDLFAE